ncbi:hypothetical protein M404DRAFT_997028 [Pisolithus tinctorius Marx 270]|uniref:Uncharacterized protein n=1 Tax=Pisolithus tinctorius Marx 270 TaxID=870435 RepID=A0A0C3PJQ7_PISTI|nr:hypothetical protein M404DRAFT_997028 [Pisolithus tinctorius Marx 270]
MSRVVGTLIFHNPGKVFEVPRRLVLVEFRSNFDTSRKLDRRVSQFRACEPGALL